MKQKLQSAMRTLRKSINKQQFYIQFSGTEYEVAQKPSRVPEGAEACSTGQVLRDGKCGKLSLGVVMLLPCRNEGDQWEPQKAFLQSPHLCPPPQRAVAWGRSTVGSRSSVSSALPVHTRTRWVSCPVSRVPAPKYRASLVPRTCLSVEVTHRIWHSSSNSTETIAVLIILTHRSGSNLSLN